MSKRISIAISGQDDEEGCPQTEITPHINKKNELKKQTKRTVKLNICAKNESAKFKPAYIQSIQKTIELTNDKVSTSTDLNDLTMLFIEN